MVRIWCAIRPHRLEAVKSAIATLGVSGLNVTDVRGVGNSAERSSWLGGEHIVSLPLKSKLEVVAPDELREPIITAILENAATGEPGDGKIFVEPILDALRIRTQERGEVAV
jgi:nitrogen regulatory protein P-II 1